MSDRLEAGGGQTGDITMSYLVEYLEGFSFLFLISFHGGGAVKLGCVLMGACPRDSCL